MNANVQIISKGLYNGTLDNGSPMLIKEYVFARDKGRKCLMLRFLNALDVSVTAFKFKIIQKNSDGEKIAESKFSIDNIDCHAGELFSPNICFFVQEKCTDFDINIISVFSGAYEYRTNNGQGYICYSQKEVVRPFAKRGGSFVQRSRLNRKVKFSAAILVFALFLISFAVIWPFYNTEVRPVIERALKILWENLGDLFELLWEMIKQLFAAIGKYLGERMR